MFVCVSYANRVLCTVCNFFYRKTWIAFNYNKYMCSTYTQLSFSLYSTHFILFGPADWLILINMYGWYLFGLRSSLKTGYYMVCVVYAHIFIYNVAKLGVLGCGVQSTQYILNYTITYWTFFIEMKVKINMQRWEKTAHTEWMNNKK